MLGVTLFLYTINDKIGGVIYYFIFRSYLIWNNLNNSIQNNKEWRRI